MATEVLVQREISTAKPLLGKVALVTGAARGIGRAIAVELASRGASIAINFRSSLSGAEALREELKATGAQATIYQGDLSHSEEAHRVVKDVIDFYQHLDILVNNASITRDKSLRKMADADWLEVIGNNLNSAFYTVSAALPGMIERKFGRIVNISSMTGQTPNFGQANYAAAKAGVIGFTKVIALEMARFNITANVVAPGYTATDMLASIPPEILAQVKSKIPISRLALPEEIAKAVAFLITDGDYITGQVLAVNGGAYM
ncbi:MAG TPA: 3-oxoacyl-ACP reductase family protein [Terriglobales bacterium]|nr:3-oxoacyl-ACP reductase family protein [Terriglobales bacterium]